jgi:hypothetical protein
MDNYNHTKIKLEMSMMDILMVMSDGNPGAATVLMQLLKDGSKIDPQDIFGGLGTIMALDTHGIYGPRIWMLYKDVCKEDLTSLIAVLRADQLGQLAGCNDAAIDHAIDNYGEGLDLPKIVEAVKTELEDFGKV